MSDDTLALITRNVFADLRGDAVNWRRTPKPIRDRLEDLERSLLARPAASSGDAPAQAGLREAAQDFVAKYVSSTGWCSICNQTNAHGPRCDVGRFAAALGDEQAKGEANDA